MEVASYLPPFVRYWDLENEPADVQGVCFAIRALKGYEV